MLGVVDLWLLRVLRTRGHAPPLERAAVLYARLGDHAALWYALTGTAALLDGRRRPIYKRVLRTIFISQVVNFGLKNTVRRARPLIEDLPALSPTMSGLSSPSAHATTSFAAAGSLAEALPGRPLYAAATLMALTRPYLGVHYPSDTVLGAVLGAALARTAP